MSAGASSDRSGVANLVETVQLGLGGATVMLAIAAVVVLAVIMPSDAKGRRQHSGTVSR